MKKTIIMCLTFIIIGFILGHKMMNNKTTPQKYYFLQEGVYDNNTIFEKNISDLRKKVLEYKNDKIYIYIGITKDKKIADKIKNIFQENNRNINIEEVWIESDELGINIEQLDLLAKKAKTTEEMNKIEEVALACYEEILKTRE